MPRDIKNSSVKWLFEGSTPQQWLLAEYQLLSQHYFHEDQQIQETIKAYGTINGALLAFLGSNLVGGGSAVRIVVPLIGIVFCIAWQASLIRCREWRNYIEERIKQIEAQAHAYWQSNEHLPLDIRTLVRWRQLAPKRRWYNATYRLFREIPSSLTDMLLPWAFGATWVILVALQFHQHHWSPWTGGAQLLRALAHVIKRLH